MKRWALLVVLLYAVILSVAVLGLALLAFLPKPRIVEDSLFLLLIWVGVFALAQAALLVVPVRVSQEQPVHRRHVFWVILAALVMWLVMSAALGMTLWDLLRFVPGERYWLVWTVGIAVGAIWLVWTFLFGFYTGNRPPQTLLSRLVKGLVAGSILELLVAVPAHVYSRMKDDCCGGFGTFWGLAAGLSVMLFAFGPAVFMLFARRVAASRSRRRREASGP